MLPPNSRDQIIVLIIGTLVLLGPVLLIVLTVGFLSLTGDLVLGRVTPVEFLELYIIDLVLFLVLGYGIYRLTLWLVEERLPESLDTLEARNAEETANGDSESSGDNRK